jgi:cytochrome P450
MMDKKSYLFCSTPSAVRQLNMDRKTFRKPVEVYEILKYFGSNVVVTEGEEWRRHRKV